MVKSLRTLATVAVALVASATSFAQDLADKLNSSYTGDLTIIINEMATPATQETIEISKQDDNTINFCLRNFILGADTEEEMAIGNINITDISLTETDGKIIIAKEQNIEIADGDKEGVEIWLGPSITESYKEVGGIPVGIAGTEENGIITLSISIPLADMMVNVVFTNKNSTNIENMTDDCTSVKYYSIDGKQTDGLKSGINIVKMSNGTTRKVVF